MGVSRESFGCRCPFKPVPSLEPNLETSRFPNCPLGQRPHSTHWVMQSVVRCWVPDSPTSAPPPAWESRLLLVLGQTVALDASCWDVAPWPETPASRLGLSPLQSCRSPRMTAGPPSQACHVGCWGGVAGHSGQLQAPGVALRAGWELLEAGEKDLE